MNWHTGAHTGSSSPELLVLLLGNIKGLGTATEEEEAAVVWVGRGSILIDALSHYWLASLLDRLLQKCTETFFVPVLMKPKRNLEA